MEPTTPTTPSPADARAPRRRRRPGLPRRLRRAGPSDTYTVFEHLDEVRARALACCVVVGIAFAACLWQSARILDLLNRPLPDGTRPLTISVAEPFMTTITMSAYAALIVSVPFIAYQVSAFVLPALPPRERRFVIPLLIAIPLLFCAGVAFGYLLVLPAATHFLLGFNAERYDIQVRAREYYSFAMLAMFATGAVFQEPVAIVAAVRARFVTVETLRRKRPLAYLVNAIVAAALPGTDPVSMLLELAPLIALYELGVLLAALFGGKQQAASHDA